MSIKSVQEYYAKVEKLIRYGGSRNESVVRKAFQELLDHYASSKNLLLVPEVEFITRRNYKVYPDGTLKDALRQSWGYWESKDEKDILEEEILTKFAKGYPVNNILFEDTQTAILYQNNERVMSASFSDPKRLDELLTLFVSYEPLEVREFHKAIELFSADVPELANTLRTIIQEQIEKNEIFKAESNQFLELCKKAINPNIEMADVREMVIQHILTEDIFMRVFDEIDFHRENAIAKNLQELARTFYYGTTKRSIDARISPYYEAINAKASQISDHHEKQKFLKALYEKFYQSYNPKAADRLGVIYTPDEIVRFMIEGTNHLLYEHFGKTLGDQYVEILDPATGTGTFITEIIEMLPAYQLEHKYENELHCNEVAILPYYIANLNIEYTYKQKTGKYKEFENICFVDTLDNMGFSRTDTHQMDFFGLWDENAERIGKQNTKKISVVIGNPPYNANQLNENENNKNRTYPEIDKRIKETYIKNSKAQKTKLYDMYVRFLRWSSDRLSQDGIVAFVSNNSFLDARSFDGFRKVVNDEFSEIYIINLKGDARTSGERRRKEGGNIFSDEIRVGIAIYFLVKKKGKKDCKIYYDEVDDYLTSEDKKSYLRENKINELKFSLINPDSNNNWLNISKGNWEGLIPVASKKMKLGKETKKDRAIFRLYSLGVATNRDEWVFDFNKENLENKVNFFIDKFNSEKNRWKNSEKNIPINDFVDRTIKWTSELENHLLKDSKLEYISDNLTIGLYRPFIKMKFYFDKIIIHRLYQQNKIFPIGRFEIDKNIIIGFSGFSSKKPFSILASDSIISLDLIEKTQCLPLYIYDENGKKTENITENSLLQFRKNYKLTNISKLEIFYYVYAVLHNPKYKDEFKINLKNDFSRIPFYTDFHQWSNWGKELMDLHINFESVSTYPLQRIDVDKEKIRKAIVPRLQARKETGLIEIDTLTTLSGLPPEVWDYKLGTYSAIEWILERYKEKSPRDPTIREKFNTYQFSDYKEQVIDLIMRVCTVSVETMKIIEQMKATEE